MTTKTTTHMLDAALAYAREGWQVLPLKTRSKVPRIKNWPREATTKERTITTWLTRWPQANIGVLAGKASSLIVIDVDRHGDANGELHLEELEASLGRLPCTPIVRTGGCGRQLYFRSPPSRRIGRITHLGGSPEHPTGVDILGEGSACTAPPSLHRSGRQYEWITPPVALGGIECAHLPRAWVDHLNQKSSKRSVRPCRASRAEFCHTPDGDDPVGRILALLDGVKRTSGGWTARCPAHDDRIPSLSVGRGDGGRVLLKCFAGCSITDIIARLALSWSDLFRDRHLGRQRPSKVFTLSDGTPVTLTRQPYRGVVS